MDLKYHDYDTNGNGKWISLKATAPTTTDNKEKIEEIKNNDSAFTTPNYIINNLIKKEGALVKYYDGTILNEKTVLDEDVTVKNFISKIELDNNVLTPTYGEMVESTESTTSGNIVSNISFNNNGNLEVTKGKLSDNLLNLISSGSNPPDEYTKGFFYLQI